jgi:EAL domain-containing protein (putative c-di-GMP-specific phosphodiesterase class I)
VTFAADTGSQIIAEGVETEDELAVVRRLGIRYAQGYHLAHPATIDGLADTPRRRPTSPRVLHNVS